MLVNIMNLLFDVCVCVCVCVCVFIVSQDNINFTL
jgi:hypothetical protein